MTVHNHTDWVGEHVEVRPNVAPLPELLDKLRLAAIACRSSPCIDVLRAYEILKSSSKPSTDTYSNALVRMYTQVSGQRPYLRVPGADPTFDEIWLMRAIERAQVNDETSLKFLVGRRIPHEHRRTFRALIKGLATISSSESS